jgi:hypothetical protein
VRRRSLRSFVPLAALTATVSGCLGWDGTIDPRVEPLAMPAGDHAAAYRVAEVRDARAFRTGIGGPWEPTLYEGDPDDPAVTSRVLARRRSSAQPRSDQRPRLGNIWLPEGQTVEALVADALTNGLRKAGLRAVEQDAVPAPDERAVRAEIEGLWGRTRPSNRILRVETWLRVRVTVPGTALEHGVLVCAESMVTTNAESGAAWRRAFDHGLADLSRRLADALRDGPPGYCISP